MEPLSFASDWEDDEREPFTRGKESTHGHENGQMSTLIIWPKIRQDESNDKYRHPERQSHVISSHGTFRAMVSFLFCTDLIMKFFLVVFYGIFPCAFRRHNGNPNNKLYYIGISLILTLAQWSCFFHYIYFVTTYWSSGEYGPIMPKETKFIQIALVASGAVTYTVVVHYFYSKSNDFNTSRTTGSSGNGWSIIPKIKFQLASTLGDEEPKLTKGLKKKDWIFTNVFLLMGLFCTISVVSTDFKMNVFYDFYGIHDFVAKLSWPRKVQYLIAVSTEFFGLGATACACCIFYVITRDLIRHIEYTENALLVEARNRDDFYFYHESLLEYSEKMMASFKYWFAIHNLFFIILVAAVVYEWFKLLAHKRQVEQYFNDILTAQIAGSSLIAFKFAFPFISASRVTAKFIIFYYHLSRKCKINGIPDLSILSNNSGFKLYGLRITTSIAFLAFFASFAGALKFISGLKY